MNHGRLPGGLGGSARHAAPVESTWAGAGETRQFIFIGAGGGGGGRGPRAPPPAPGCRSATHGCGVPGVQGGLPRASGRGIPPKPRSRFKNILSYVILVKILGAERPALEQPRCRRCGRGGPATAHGDGRGPAAQLPRGAEDRYCGEVFFICSY